MQVKEGERNPREKSCKAKIMQPQHPISVGWPFPPQFLSQGPVSPAYTLCAIKAGGEL